MQGAKTLKLINLKSWITLLHLDLLCLLRFIILSKLSNWKHCQGTDTAARCKEWPPYGRIAPVFLPFLALDGHEYFPSCSLSVNPVKYNKTAGYTGPKFILEATEQRDYSPLWEINLIYRVFKAVTHSEKERVLSAHLPNAQQAIWTAGLALNECYKQITNGVCCWLC